MDTIGSGDKVVLVAEQPFLFATIDRVDVDDVAGMLFEVPLEGAEFELHRGVGEIEQTVGHVDVIEGSRQGNDGRIVAEVYDYVLRVGRRRAASRVRARHDLDPAIGPVRVGVRIVGMVARMVGSDAKRATVDQAQFVVRQVDVLEALTHKGIAVNLIDMTVAQIERYNVVVRIAVGS